MTNIALIPSDRITVDTGRMRVPYVEPRGAIVVRAEHGAVVLFAGSKRVEMTTIVAHRIGLRIARNLVPQLAAGELVVLTINGERIELLGEVALRVAGALLRKADDADDWQLQHRRRLQ